MLGGKGLLGVMVGVVSIGGFLFGYDTGVVSGGIIFLKEDWGLSSWEEEMVISVTVLSAALGCVLSAHPAAVWGRLPVLIFAAMAYTLGALIVAAAGNLAALVTGRFILGIGVGVASYLCPIYIAEIAPKEKRASLVTINNVLIVTGQVISCVVNIAVDDMPRTYNWRISMGLAAAPSLLMGIGLAMLPESPRWLLEQGRDAEALAALSGARGETEEESKGEFDAMKRGIEMEKEKQLSISDVMGNGALRRAFLLAIVINAGQQVSGINTMMYYGAVVMELVGFPDDESVELTALLAATQGLGLILAMWLYARLPRRQVLFSSMSGVIVGLLGISFSFTSISKYQGLAMGSVLLYLFTFGLGFSSGPYILDSEVFPTSIRATGAATGATAMWVANFLVSATFLTEVDSVGESTAFLGYALMTMATLAYLYAYMPETHGLSCEEAYALLEEQDRQGQGAKGDASSTAGDTDEASPMIPGPTSEG